MRGLGLGFTNPVERGRVLDVCLYLGCSGVGGEWQISHIQTCLHVVVGPGFAVVVVCNDIVRVNE